MVHLMYTSRDYWAVGHKFKGNHIRIISFKEQTHYCLYASASALYCDAKSLWRLYIFSDIEKKTTLLVIKT